MNLALWLARAAHHRPAAPALLTGTRCDADYATFARRASAIANELRVTFRIRPGDRIGLFMPNSTAYLEALFGIWWAGAVAVPMNAKLHPKEAAWICTDAGCKLVFVSNESGATLAGQNIDLPDTVTLISVDEQPFRRWRNTPSGGPPQERAGVDLAWLFYTSGTTGRPKGAMLTWANLQAMALCYFADVASVAPTDASLYAAPISHGAGMYMLPHLRAGARHVVPDSEGFDSQEILDLASELRDLSLFAAPTMVRRLVACAATSSGRDGSGLKTVVYGGGPMYLADIEEALNTLGPRFAQIYGQAESPMTITALARHWHSDTNNRRYRARLASVGVPMSAVQVRVVDAEDRAVPPGDVGTIMVKGTTVMAGYWRNPDATESTIRSGWLDTGDVGVFDEDGFLSLRDRSKDMIISGGTNIYPREIEEVLLQHGDVVEAAVIGQPHEDWGEEVVACLVLKPGRVLDEVALDKLCLGHLARFKRPRRYMALDSLPKNNYGKVLKTALRQRFAAQTGPID